jgi:hypothetical protein
MALRFWVVMACLALGCQPQLAASASGDTLATFDDGAAFAVGFPPSVGFDATASEDPFEPGFDDDAAAGSGEGASDASNGVSPADDATSDAFGDDGTDSAEEGGCAAPLSPGDLIIDELMIESVAGSGDDGEWLEVTSTLDCAVNLLGLHGECPRGASVITFDVTSDLWVPAGGSFVVADSVVPAINHYLPGAIVAWSGRQGDILRNEGSTVSLRMNDVLVDSITYPALKLSVGKSWAFPADCDPSLRSDFAKWQPSAYSFFPAFFGTPNAPNVDVQCP